MENWRPWTLRHLYWRAEAIRQRMKASDDATWWKVAYICWQNAAANSWKKFTGKLEDFNPNVASPSKLTEGGRIAGIREAAKTMPKTFEAFKAEQNAKRKRNRGR